MMFADGEEGIALYRKLTSICYFQKILNIKKRHVLSYDEMSKPVQLLPFAELCSCMLMVSSACTVSVWAKDSTGL